MSQRHRRAAAADVAVTPQPSVAQPFSGRRVVVEVPATSANLGPGFDCVGLALNMRNTFEITIIPSVTGANSAAPCAVELAPMPDGSGHAPDIALSGDNLFCRAFALLCERRGVPPPMMRVRITAAIPPGRGLGSSATAVVGGLLAASALLDQPCSSAELLELAIACEPGGHADNVAAALLGGLVVTGANTGDGSIIALPLPVPAGLRTVVFIPDQPMSTVAGRALLPARYSRDDVSFNLSRLALLLAALQTGHFDALATAMEDRVHQPYRQHLFPQLGSLIDAALAASAHGACLSGGGSSVLALVSDAHQAERVRDALTEASQSLKTPGRCVIADIARQGARAARLDHPAAQTNEGGLA
ncbi:MAG TPA: homoserine kinase [Ktedonobacterales bacterium]|nr:homoserine kinase [Ktedonobacterales bacterium]